MDCSMPGFPVSYHLQKLAQVHVHCIGDVMQPSHSLMPPFLSAFNLSQHQGLFQSHLFASDDQNTGVSASASVLPTSAQRWFSLRLTDLTPYCSRDFQESSPAPQFESINSLGFCLHYSPALTTLYDHWEDHTLDYMDLCWQNNVSAFQHTVYVCHSFPIEKQSSISWLQSPSAVILKTKKKKSVTASTFSPPFAMK